MIETPKLVKEQVDHHQDYMKLQSLYFKLLYDESSEETQLACVEIIRRILGHTSPGIPVTTRSQWTTCFQYLLLHVNTDEREAFCAQLATAKDLLVIQTLLEATAEVTSELFLFSLFQLIDHLDNPNLIVRTNASMLIKRYILVNGGFALLLSRAAHIQDELFYNLSVRLTSRPNVVREFAEAVGVDTGELAKKMVHVVLPKLLVYWQENPQAANTLNELAKLLNTDAVPLIVNWLPRVLAFALNQKEEKISALSFAIVLATYWF